MDEMYKRKDVSDSKIELTINMSRDAFEQSYNAMLKDQTKDTNIKGFRKGKVPTDLLEPGMKPMLQFETFERLAPMYINTAIQKEKLEIIAPPKYSELPDFKDEEKGLQFKVEITVMPDFKLGNLKKVKVEKESGEIKDEEVDKVLKELKRNNETKEKEIGDDWAKEISEMLELEGIKNLEDLKKMVKDTLKKQKDHMLLHKYQEDALAQAIKISKIEMPEEAIQFEADERKRSFEEEMKSRGVKVEDFIKQSKVSMEEMEEAWKKDGKEALETDVFLNLYAGKNEIKVTKEELDKKIELIKKSQPDADANIFSNDQWLEYIKRVEKKEKAFREFIKEVLGDEFLDEHN